jgi:alkylation response protein AidB-like acyl-CoA dehydrogenase
MMIIDMSHPGVEVRPLRTLVGSSEFNEVFLDDVFVPDADVVGEVNNGWAVARATLGNERVSIGGSQAGGYEVSGLFDLYRERGAGVPGLAERVGRHVAESHALRALNLRSAVRAVTGAGPGPEGNISKLVGAERGAASAALYLDLVGPEAAFAEGLGAEAGRTALAWRHRTIAGGTSEISRNQIAERILGLPRDPALR